MFELATWPRSSWSIFDEMESLQEDMNRIFNGRREPAEGRMVRRRASAYPLMNVWSSKEGLVIDAELPGVDPKDVEISVVGDELSIKGRVGGAEVAEGETYHRRERPTGEFSRTLQLPFRANAEGVKAAYKNGVLRLTVPRSEEERPKKIAIEA